MSGLTLLNGSTAGSGGGLYTTSPVTLTQVTFLSNTAALAGGGFYAGATATLNGASFRNNQCAAGGCLSQGWYVASTLTLGQVITTSDSIQNQGATSQAAGSVILFNGAAGQTITGSGSTTLYDLWLNNSGAGVTLGQNLTVTNRLTLSSDLTTTTGAALSLGANATTAGAGEVWGRTVRAHPFTLNTAYAFGNPFVSLDFTGGTPPSQVTIDLTRTLPFSFANAIARVYQIEPVGGSGYLARLRLHYRDGELNGNAEGTLQLWRYPVGGPWTGYAATGFDATDNWVERNGVSALSAWTLSQYFPIYYRLYLPLITQAASPFP